MQGNDALVQNGLLLGATGAPLHCTLMEVCQSVKSIPKDRLAAHLAAHRQVLLLKLLKPVVLCESIESLIGDGVFMSKDAAKGYADRCAFICHFKVSCIASLLHRVGHSVSPQGLRLRQRRFGLSGDRKAAQCLPGCISTAVRCVRFAR